MVIIASGPSLVPGDVDHVKGRARCLVINDNYEVAPWADAHYFCDMKWIGWHWEKGFKDFAGKKYTADQGAAVNYNLRYIRGDQGEGLSTDPALIHYGQNSGHQAINLAYHLGASRILLLGYDFKFADSGASHWFGDHPDNIRSNYKRWIPAMEKIAQQDLVEIINCSRDTALECFPRSTIQAEL